MNALACSSKNVDDQNLFVTNSRGGVAATGGGVVRLTGIPISRQQYSFAGQFVHIASIVGLIIRRGYRCPQKSAEGEMSFLFVISIFCASRLYSRTIRRLEVWSGTLNRSSTQDENTSLSVLLSSPSRRNRGFLSPIIDLPLVPSSSGSALFACIHVNAERQHA